MPVEKVAALRTYFLCLGARGDGARPLEKNMITVYSKRLYLVYKNNNFQITIILISQRIYLRYFKLLMPTCLACRQTFFIITYTKLHNSFRVGRRYIIEKG